MEYHHQMGVPYQCQFLDFDDCFVVIQESTNKRSQCHLILSSVAGKTQVLVLGNSNLYLLLLIPYLLFIFTVIFPPVYLSSLLTAYQGFQENLDQPCATQYLCDLRNLTCASAHCNQLDGKIEQSWSSCRYISNVQSHS